MKTLRFILPLVVGTACAQATAFNVVSIDNDHYEPTPGTKLQVTYHMQQGLAPIVETYDIPPVGCKQSFFSHEAALNQNVKSLSVAALFAQDQKPFTLIRETIETPVGGFTKVKINFGACAMPDKRLLNFNFVLPSKKI